MKRNYLFKWKVFLIKYIIYTEMIDDKRIYFSIAIVFILLLLIAYGYFFVSDNIPLRSLPDPAAPVSLPEGKTLKLNDGWEAFSDADFKNPVEITPDVFRTGEYYFRLILNTENMSGSNAFLVNPLHSAYSLRLNGELLGQFGEPGSESEQLSSMRCRTIPFKQIGDRLEIHSAGLEPQPYVRRKYE